MKAISVTVNGEEREAEVEPRQLLVYFLREQLGLTGTNVGCDTSTCGSCTVLVDGRSVKSCTLLAVQADGAEATIEAAVTPTADGGTHVAMDTNVRFSGQAAQLGRPSVVDDVSRKLVSDFAAAIAEGLRHGVAPAQGPADGLGIARAALSGAISRQFRRFERPEGGSS